MSDIEFKKAIEELEVLYTRKQDAAKQYKDGLDAVSQQYGHSKSALNANVAAKVKNSTQELVSQADEISEIGALIINGDRNPEDLL
jgi:hypothetical protein